MFVNGALALGHPGRVNGDEGTPVAGVISESMTCLTAVKAKQRVSLEAK